jgi:hypothetical protein
MAYRKSSNYRRPQQSGPRPNTYAGTCATCGEPVAAGMGILTGTRATGYTTTHAPASLKGSPISGGYVNGCPAETDKLNRGLGHTEGAYVSNLERARLINVEPPPSRGRRVPRAYTSSGAQMFTRGCGHEDYPCCGC